MASLAAVLVNYNSDGELRRALESIAREANGQWEGVVVDNASIDRSEQAALDFPAVRLLKNGENVGFARGVNQAIAATTSDYVLVMNPDCQLSVGALTPLIALLDAHATCAVAAPQVLDPDGTPQVTWAFVLDEISPGVTRLLVRARVGPGYRFHGLPLPLTKLAIRIVHFVMQRKQLLGIAARAEACRLAA